MNYKVFILPTIIILTTPGNVFSALTAQKFPSSPADITFSQKVNIYSDGYEPYRGSIIYQGITIDESKENSSQSNAANNNNNMTGSPTPQQQNITNVQNQEQNLTNNNNSQDTQQQSQPIHPTPPPPQIINPERRACFAQDTHSAKRYIPPRVTTQRAYWWLGDSRFTGMYINGVIGRNTNEAVVAHAGRGHQWLTNTPNPTGISLLETCLRDGDVVILNLGANDISKYNSYISTYRQLMSNHPNVIFKVLSVNPVCDSKARLQNTQIETFNTNLKNAFRENFIDTYSIVKPMVTESTTDAEGLHYRGGNIEQTIYNTVMSSVAE